MRGTVAGQLDNFRRAVRLRGHGGLGLGKRGAEVVLMVAVESIQNLVKTQSVPDSRRPCVELCVRNS